MKLTFFEIAKELFPMLPQDDLYYILWEYTGYPEFWSIPQDGATPEECCRKQLMELKEKSGLELL